MKLSLSDFFYLGSNFHLCLVDTTGESKAQSRFRLYPGANGLFFKAVTQSMKASEGCVSAHLEARPGAAVAFVKDAFSGSSWSLIKHLRQ